jgi:hypothetical protein
MSSTDLAPVQAEIERSAPLMPMLGAGDAAAAMSAYQELCAAVLTPADWIGAPGEPDSFVRRSGWDKLATFYGASVVLLGETKLERDADGRLLRASARARATDPRTGRVRDGGGACGRDEPRFATSRGRQKIEHDLPASAETRATNRAIANLVGFGAVSAEEVDGSTGASTAPLPDWAADIPDDALGRLEANLVAILDALDAPEPERAALDVGNRITTYCGGAFPAVAARLARLLAQAIPQPAPPTAAAEPEPEADEPPADATPDEPPEGENE